MTCRHCHRECSESIDGTCTSCGILISRLKDGSEFYNGRFKIEGLAEASKFVLVWDVFDSTERQPRHLLEYRGSQRADVAGRRRFNQTVKQLQKLGEVLVPPLFPLTFEDRYYLVQVRQDNRDSLGTLINSSAGVSDKQAARYFWNIIDCLEAIHSAPVPLYHGNLTLASIRQGEKGSVLLTKLCCLSQSANLPAETARREDLFAAAVVGAQLLCGSIEGHPDPPPKWQKRVEALTDVSFAATIEWVLGPPKRRPGSARDLKTFRDLIEEARGHETAGRLDEAIRCYDKAYNVSGAGRVRTILDNLKDRCGTSRTEVSVPKAKPEEPAAAAAAKQSGVGSPSAAPQAQGPKTHPSQASPDRTIRINELARELAVKPSVILDALPKIGITDKKTDSSSLDQEEADHVRHHIRTDAAITQPGQQVHTTAAKRCPKCNLTFDFERVFCENCGSMLEQVGAQTRGFGAAPVESPQAQPRQAEYQPTILTAQTPPPPPPNGKGRLVAGVFAAVVSICGLVYYFSGALEREFDSTLNNGNLAAANTRSAWMIYQEALQKKGPNSATVRSINAKARPVLDRRSQEIFDNWYRTSDLGNLTWDEVARIEEWRNQISSDSETRARTAYAQGMVSFIRKNYSDALRLFNEAVRHKPNWSLGLNGVGRAYFNLRRFDMAEQYYRRATEADPRWYFPYFNLANLYRDVLRNDSLAEEYYQKAISLDSGRPSFHYGLATLYFRKGKSFWPQACQEYRRSLEESASGSLTPAEATIANQRVLKICQ
jgi:tetratricopeptide (TPR) repeat protein